MFHTWRGDEVRSNATPPTITVSFADSRAGIAFSDRRTIRPQLPSSVQSIRSLSGTRRRTDGKAPVYTTIHVYTIMLLPLARAGKSPGLFPLEFPIHNYTSTYTLKKTC